MGDNTLKHGSQSRVSIGDIRKRSAKFDLEHTEEKIYTRVYTGSSGKVIECSQSEK